MKTYDLNLLTTLEALLAAGSVTAAAERLHLSVPATSHALARLREVMGDAILVRAGRQMVPTPRALALREPVARLLAQARGLVAPPDSRDLTGVQRAFVLRAPDGMAVAYGAALATALLQAMPHATLHFVPEAHGDTGALREGRIDLDIGAFRTRDPEVESVEISRQAQVIAVAAAQPLARGRRSARRYAAQDHVAVMQRPRETSLVDEALAGLGLQRRIVLTVPSSYAALAVAARSLLVATVPARMARVMAPGLQLAVFDLPFEVAFEPTVMAWHPRYNADPAHTWLRALMQRVISDSKRRAPPLDSVRGG